MKAGPPASSGVRPHSERFPEALLSLLYAPEPVHFNSSVVSWDCLAHVDGNAADHPDRGRRRPSDMTDAEWAEGRPLLPVPAWLQGRGGQPEGYCHRQMLDAIRYLVAGGISWRAMPADFPAWGHVYAFFRRWREHGLIAEFHDRLRGRVRERDRSRQSPRRRTQPGPRPVPPARPLGGSVRSPRPPTPQPTARLPPAGPPPARGQPPPAPPAFPAPTPPRTPPS
ncbi:transposase [Streptomyces sp. NPDC020742]|uniref:transposase n=1 Tax=Streptomyces sp. NPDC020742 TaxID=3154897 RepID=UPI0033F29ACF